MWAYLFRQPISFHLWHPHQFLSEGVGFALGGGFFGADWRFIVEGSFVEVDEVRVDPLPPVRAVPGVVSYLPAFEAGVIVSTRCDLGNAASRGFSLSSPLV